MVYQLNRRFSDYAYQLPTRRARVLPGHDDTSPAQLFEPFRNDGPHAFPYGNGKPGGRVDARGDLDHAGSQEPSDAGGHVTGDLLWSSRSINSVIRSIIFGMTFASLRRRPTKTPHVTLKGNVLLRLILPHRLECNRDGYLSAEQVGNIQAEGHGSVFVNEAKLRPGVAVAATAIVAAASKAVAA